MGEDQTNRANEGKLLVTLPAIAFRSFSNKDLGSALNRFYFVVGNCGGGGGCATLGCWGAISWGLMPRTVPILGRDSGFGIPRIVGIWAQGAPKLQSYTLLLYDKLHAV